MLLLLLLLLLLSLLLSLSLSLSFDVVVVVVSNGSSNWRVAAKLKDSGGGSDSSWTCASKAVV